MRKEFLEIYIFFLSLLEWLIPYEDPDVKMVYLTRDWVQLFFMGEICSGALGDNWQGGGFLMDLSNIRVTLWQEFLVDWWNFLGKRRFSLSCLPQKGVVYKYLFFSNYMYNNFNDLVVLKSSFYMSLLYWKLKLYQIHYLIRVH